MLERLEIRNFQNHELLRIEFGRHVTTIVGPSDVGKTSIMRAIRWLATDRPLGSHYIRHGERNCLVKLWADGKRIRKQKGEKNEYRIDDQIMTAWGTSGPPEPVLQFLNVGPINFQSQHDAPFWFSLTPGDVGRELNAIVDLGSVDEILGSLAASLRGVRSESEVVESRLSGAEQLLQRHSDVPLLTTSFNSLVELENSSFHISGLARSLSRAVSTIKEYYLRGEELKAAASHGARVVDLGERVSQLQRQIDMLDDCLTNALNHQRVVNKPIPETDILERPIAACEELQKELRHVKGLMEQHRMMEETMRVAASELSLAENQLMDETKGMCPICGNPLK